MPSPPLLNLPDSACIASVIMTINRTVGITQSPFTKEEQAFLWPGAVWSMDFSLPPLTDPDAVAEWKAFALKLQGAYGRFLAGDPAYRGPRGAATGTPVVNGANQTGNSLVTSGWSPSVTGILKAGDYIQVGSGVTSRLLMVTDDVNSSAGGAATIPVEPNIGTAPNNGSAVVVNNPRGVFRLQDNTWAWSVAPGFIHRLSFQAVSVPNA